jgi:hypothetical protein
MVIMMPILPSCSKWHNFRYFVMWFTLFLPIVTYIAISMIHSRGTYFHHSNGGCIVHDSYGKHFNSLGNVEMDTGTVA